MNKKINEAPNNFQLVPQRMDSNNRSIDQQVSDLKDRVDSKNGDTVQADGALFEDGDEEQFMNKRNPKTVLNKTFTKKELEEQLRKSIKENKVFTKKELEKKRVDNIFENGLIYNKRDLKKIFEGIIKEDANGLHTNDPFTQFFMWCNDPKFRSTAGGRRDQYGIVWQRNKLIAAEQPYENPDDLLKMISSPEYQNEGWMMAVGKTFKMFGRKIPIDGNDSEIYRKIIIKAQQLPEGQWLANQINFFINNAGNKSLGQVSQQSDMGIVDQNAEKKDRFINQALLNDIKETFQSGQVNSLNVKNITDMLYQNIDNRTDAYKMDKLPCNPNLLLLWGAMTNQPTIIDLGQKNGGRFGKGIGDKLGFGRGEIDSKKYILNSKSVGLKTLEYLMDRGLITKEDIQAKYNSNQKSQQPIQQKPQPQQMGQQESYISKKEIVEHVMNVIKKVYNK